MWSCIQTCSELPPAKSLQLCYPNFYCNELTQLPLQAPYQRKLSTAAPVEAGQQRGLPVSLAALLCAEAAHRGRCVWLGRQ